MTELGQGVSVVSLYNPLSYTQFTELIINNNLSLTSENQQRGLKMCALSHRRVKPFVALLFGRLSGVSTCGISCLTGNSLVLPAMFVLGGWGRRNHKGSSSRQHRQMPGSSCCMTDNICFTCRD